MSKRILDITLTLLIISFFFPIGLIISLILLFTGEGEIFYLQERIKRKKQRFKIIKFATMLKNSPAMGAGDITLLNDSRVLPFGKFLRKTKLNEFPQFLNVLTGDMSLVGPRPLVENQYNQFDDQYKQILFSLKPGITGVGSLIFRDEEVYLNRKDANIFYVDEIIPFKCELELWYKQNQSFMIDLLIILMTSVSIFLPLDKYINLVLKDLPKHKIFNDY